MDFTFKWMVWTLPTAIFCASIIIIVVAMAVWQTLSPSLERKGFLPIPTTPGDRFFIGVLTSVYIFFAWVGLTQFSLLILLLIVICWMLVVMTWG